MPCPSEEECDLVNHMIIMRLFSLLGYGHKFQSFPMRFENGPFIRRGAAAAHDVTLLDRTKDLGTNFGFMSHSDINHTICAFHRPPILVVSHTLMKFREEDQRRRMA